MSSKIEEKIPLKQGLKLSLIRPLALTAVIEEKIPLKQGLKQKVLNEYLDTLQD